MGAQHTIIDVAKCQVCYIQLMTSICCGCMTPLCSQCDPIHLCENVNKQEVAPSQVNLVGTLTHPALLPEVVSLL